MLIPHHLNPPISREKDIQRYTPYLGYCQLVNVGNYKKTKTKREITAKMSTVYPHPPFPRKWERASSAASPCAFEGGGGGFNLPVHAALTVGVHPSILCPCYCKCYRREWHALHALFAAHSGHGIFSSVLLIQKGQGRRNRGPGGQGRHSVPPKNFQHPKSALFF